MIIAEVLPGAVWPIEVLWGVIGGLILGAVLIWWLERGSRR